MPESPNTTASTIGRATSHEHLGTTNASRNAELQKHYGMNENQLRAGFQAADRFDTKTTREAADPKSKYNKSLLTQSQRELENANLKRMSVTAAQELAKYEK